VNLIELCRELVQTDSTIAAGSLDIVKAIESLSYKIGLYSEIQEESIEGVSEFNILVSPVPLKHVSEKKADCLLLVNHIDTWNPGPLAMWKKQRGNPFDLIIEDQKLFGLGVAENKADIAAKLLALSEFKQINLSVIPVFLGVFGHQSGMRGMQRWLKKNNYKIKHAIIGEPTQLRFVFAINGYAKIDIVIPYADDESQIRIQNTLKDVTATSTRLFKGYPKSGVDFDNSMDLLKDVFQYFDALPCNSALIDFDGGTQFNLEPHQILTEIDSTSHLSSPMIKKITCLYQAFSELHAQMKVNSNPIYKPSNLTFNIGMIRSNNLEVSLFGIVRIPPHITSDEILDWEKKSKSICARFGAKLQLADFKPSYMLPKESTLKALAQKRLQQLGLSDESYHVYLSNEACLLGRKGIDCAVFGPGVSANNLHSPNEYVEIDQVQKAHELYKHWIREENL